MSNLVPIWDFESKAKDVQKRWKMKKVCAWCGKNLGSVASKKGFEHGVTHGICGNCKDNLLFQMGVGNNLGVFLNNLKRPILAVNREGTIVSANNQVKTLLQHGLSGIEGNNGCELFECIYARLPEGHGNTIYCSGCDIRRTVMETHATGRSYLKIPVSLSRNTPEGPEKLNLLISTAKNNDLVFLRIDHIKDVLQKNTN